MDIDGYRHWDHTMDLSSFFFCNHFPNSWTHWKPLLHSPDASVNLTNVEARHAPGWPDPTWFGIHIGYGLKLGPTNRWWINAINIIYIYYTYILSINIYRHVIYIHICKTKMVSCISVCFPGRSFTRFSLIWERAEHLQIRSVEKYRLWQFVT